MKSLPFKFLTLLGCLMMALAVTPALASDPPKITVAPVWRPATQLTTIGAIPTDPGDDIRYADAEIYVTTSVQFWAVQLTCTVNKTVLESYIQDADPVDFQDDGPVVTWGLDWGPEGIDFTQVPAFFNPATGTMTLTATLLGNRWPLGNNGYNTTLLLATVRYRIKTVAGTSPFTCTANFLNRNGTSVLTPTITAPAPLSIIPGYTIAGKVTYQARTIHTGIGVDCTFDPGGANITTSTTTTSTGAFAITNLRDLGFYYCEFFGNIINPAAGYQTDLYLRAGTGVDLSAQSSHTFLPVILRSGNLDRTGPSQTFIDNDDLSMVTGNWNMPTILGDANGDLKTDRADLAIVGGNYYEGENRDASHMVFGLARNYDGNFFPNSRVWLGEPWAGDVTQLVTGTSRDFWPTLSPDGTKIAFVREVSGKYALYTIAASGTGIPTRLTPPTAWYDAFAPSWSPDGTRIAFNCSWNAADNPDPNNRGWPFDQADVCVIDATGRNWQDITNFYGDEGHIYPPAWLSNSELIYGGTSYNPTCPSTLCYFNLQTLEQRAFDADIPTGDMPAIRFGTLFYRFTTGPNRTLRMAEIDAGGVSAFPTTTFPVHVEAQYDSVDPQGDGTGLVPLSTDLDYYTVSATGRNIVFYESMGPDFTNAFFNWGAPAPQWWGPTPLPRHWVHDNAGNPFWSGNPNDPTDLFALRNTVDWTP